MKSDFKISLPKDVEVIISRLEERGYKAYAVGGAVRDSLLGKSPDDWDVTTSAVPDGILEVFSDLTVIKTGVKHGTVTVRLNGKNYEVTTFRRDGDYLDSRRPESVEFSLDVKEDLMRRDFTVNAMAYNEKEGLIDLYGGIEDLNAKILRAVGDPLERFGEDALRILRGVRFASQTGFKIERETYEAMKKRRSLLSKVSAERVFAETDKLLKGDFVKEALLLYPEVIFEVIPELKPSYKFEQHTKWHLHDVYTHTAIATASIKNRSELRWCMLLHDIAKPEKFFTDENGVGHFYGHPELSSVMANGILKRLKAPTKFTERVCLLIKNHDKPFPKDRKKFKRLLCELGEENVRALILIKYADHEGQGTKLAIDSNSALKEAENLLDDIIKNSECFSLGGLEINGDDVKEVGFKGKEIGEVLQSVLEDIISGNIPNDRQKLLKSIQKRAERRLQT